MLDGRRDRALLATKVRIEEMGEGPNDAGLSRHHVISRCEASLRRLRTDHIDLYQVHEWDGQTPLEETLEALDLLVSSGKVRYVGASSYTAWQLMKALGVAERAWPAAFRQPADLLLAAGPRGRVRADPARRRSGPRGAGLEPPLAGGLLSGEYRRDHRGGGSSLTLAGSERELLDKISAPPLIYPYWHQARTASDRLSPADLTLLVPYLPSRVPELSYGRSTASNSCSGRSRAPAGNRRAHCPAPRGLPTHDARLRRSAPYHQPREPHPSPTRIHSDIRFS